MKKKFVTILLGAALSLSIVGCGSKVPVSDKQFDLSSIPTAEDVIVFDANSVETKKNTESNQEDILVSTEEIKDDSSGDFIIEDMTDYDEVEDSKTSEEDEIVSDFELKVDNETEVDISKYMEDYERFQLNKVVRIENVDDSSYIQNATTIIEMPTKDKVTDGYSSVIIDDGRGYEYSVKDSDCYLVVTTSDGTEAYHSTDDSASGTWTFTESNYSYEYIGNATVKGIDYVVVKAVEDDSDLGEMGYYFFVNPLDYSLSYQVTLSAGLPSSYKDLSKVTMVDVATDLSKRDYEFTDVSYEEITSKMFEILGEITKQ